ncbi:site-specific integrase [archaeon]|jgi:integrase|nr:site-specific integrase [archaeon]
MDKTVVVDSIKERVDKTGRRWIQDLEKTYDKAKEKYSKQSKSKNKSYILDYLQQMRLGDGSKKQERRRITKSRALRIMGILKNFDDWMQGKEFLLITKQDMHNFVEKLDDGILVSPSSGKEYAETTKATIKKVIRKYWKWLKGDNNYYPKEVDWMDTYEPRPDMTIYSYDEIELIRDSFRPFQMKTLVWLLFDSGARINELLNLKIKDVIKPNGQARYLSVRFRDEISKRAGRTVGLYLSTFYLATYLKKHHTDPNNPEAYLFTYGYNAVRTKLYVKGKAILGKSLTPHRIRGSSATYYATRIKTYQNFCYRFGWSLSSRVPDIYYRRAGVKSNEVMNEIFASERAILQSESMGDRLTTDQLLLENKRLTDKVSTYKKKVSGFERYEPALMELLKNPAIKEQLIELMSKEISEDTKLIQEAQHSLEVQQ